jgi:hypothetical protein
MREKQYTVVQSGAKTRHKGEAIQEISGMRKKVPQTFQGNESISSSAPVNDSLYIELNLIFFLYIMLYRVFITELVQPYPLSA